MEKSATDQGTVTVNHRRLTWLEALLLRYRLTASIVLHVILFTLALLLAYLVRFDATGERDRPWFFNSFLRWLPVFVILKLTIFAKMRLLRGGWRYASIHDIYNILQACWWSVLVIFVLSYLFTDVPLMFGRRPPAFFQGYSKGILVLDFLATVFLTSTARLAFRLYREELRPIAAEGVQRLLIVGAGDAADTLIREINHMRVERYRMVGLVDDDPAKRHLQIHGAPVLGRTTNIKQICKKHKIDEIFIAIPSATQKQLSRVVELCTGTKLKFKSLPSLQDLIDGRVTVSQIRPVDINDLLGRKAVELDDKALAQFLHQRRVLITGAGGSIGSEMCRQVCRYGPARLILVEQAENPMFEIEAELVTSHAEIPLSVCICDVFDRQDVMAIWEQHRPEVVIHAAAHKHVPLMEQNPWEAIKNNALATKNVADASVAYGVDEFVMISTDKAVNPSSVMGATKRIAEIYTQALNGRDACKTQFKAVRFGNVLGSAGSVIPIFRKQIAQGGPVRVTHPAMSRYFMTIPESAQLVLQAAATGTGGQIYLLDMGEPVKIVDLARQMITLSGFRPGEDIDIIFTGIRPGEKLFEELHTKGENIEPTVHPKVLVWRSRPTKWEVVERAIEELTKLQTCHDRQPIIEALRRIVPEYNPHDPPRPDRPVKKDRAPLAAEARGTGGS